MKPSPAEVSGVTARRLLILSDGKPGHVNQSIAFARHLGHEYDLSPVSFKNRPVKACSYLLDRMGIYSAALFHPVIEEKDYAAVVSAGSGTYYANRTVARRLGCKSVAIMLPRGYRFDFDLIVAQQHDDPPARANILSLPTNLSYVSPSGLVNPEPGEKYIAVIIGGDSRQAHLNVAQLRRQITDILKLFPEHRVWMTTSRRTPESVEKFLHEFSYDRAVYYSQEPINPIPDYLQHSEYVFLTADSSSMISEAVSFGHSCVEILPLSGKFPGSSKFTKLLKNLSEAHCIHLFDGQIGNASEKINLARILDGVRL